MGEPVRWGILGAASFARRVMGPAIHAAEGAELAALATRSADNAAGFSAFAPRMQVHESYEALLADSEIDAVYIPLPNSMHVDWSIRALEAGKAVLCEKPVGMDVAEIDRLIAVRDATGVFAAEAYMIVHHPQWQRAKALVAEGAIGEVLHVGGAFTFRNIDAENIRNRPETGGGALRDIGVYTIGSARFVMGAEPENITAHARWEGGVDTHAEAQADLGGARFTFRVSTRMVPWQEMTFHGTDGVIRLTAPFNAGSHGQADLHILRLPDHSTIEHFPDARQYVNQVEAFGRTIRDGAPYPVPLEWSRGTQAAIDTILAVTN